MHPKCVAVVNSDSHKYSSLIIESDIPSHAVNVPDHVLCSVHLIMFTPLSGKMNPDSHLKKQVEP